MKKIFILTLLGLTLFSSTAILQPSTAEAAEVTTNSAPSQAYFEIDIPYTNVDRIWHSEYKYGVNYSGYLYYKTEYVNESGVRTVYGGMLRQGSIQPLRINEEIE